MIFGAPPDLPIPEHGVEEAREAAREILSRPEFHPPPKPLTQQAMEWVLERIARFIDALTSGGRASLIAWTILLASVAVIVLVVVRLLASIRANPIARQVITESDVGRPARAWLAEAEAHEAAGEWRAALRCRYRALVADLAHRGLVDEVPGRTAGEYRSEVRVALPRAAPDFDGATELFEVAWYGGGGAGQDERDRFRAHADRVLAGANA